MIDAFTKLVIWRLPTMAIRIGVYTVAAIAVMLYFNFSTLQDYFHARERRAAYAESVTSLQRQYNELVKEQDELKNNGFDKEKAIRERWLMVKPGEQILFIDPPATADEGTSKTTSIKPAAAGRSRRSAAP